MVHGNRCSRKMGKVFAGVVAAAMIAGGNFAYAAEPEEIPHSDPVQMEEEGNVEREALEMPAGDSETMPTEDDVFDEDEAPMDETEDENKMSSDELQSEEEQKEEIKEGGGETDSNEELEENAEKKTCVTEDGWKEMEEGKTFYVSDGKVIRDSWHKVGDHNYYFGTDGIMYKNCRFQVRSEDENVGWGEYRVDKSGRMVTGW